MNNCYFVNDSIWLQPATTLPNTHADATQQSSCVAMASAVWTQFATSNSSRRLPTDSVDNLETDQTDCIAVWLREFCSILINFSTMNDVIMSWLVTNLNSSTAQEIVNWVTTAVGWVYNADVHDAIRFRCWQICSDSSKLSPTSCELRTHHTADATQSRLRCGVYGICN